MEVRPDAEVASETSRTRRWATRGRSRSATSNIKPAAAYVTGLFVRKINAADVDLRRASICFCDSEPKPPQEQPQTVLAPHVRRLVTPVLHRHLAAPFDHLHRAGLRGGNGRCSVWRF
jgi:hypothetical protein